MGREARVNKSQEHAKFFNRTDPKEKEQNEKDFKRVAREMYSYFNVDKDSLYPFKTLRRGKRKNQYD